MLSNLEIIGWKKFRRQPKLDEDAGRVQFDCPRNFLNPIISKLDKHVVLLLINYIASQLLGIAQLHGGEMIWISHSSKFYVRDSSCHENIKFISSSKRLMFFLLYKRADDAVFDDSPTISDHFPKISQDFPKLFWRPHERFRTFSEHFRTFSEDYRRYPKIAEGDRRCFDHTSINFSEVEGASEKCCQTWFLDCPIFSKLDSLPLLKENPIWNYPN